MPSLTVNFGDIGPGQIAIGRWLLTSSLQGLFTDYSATFEHLDDLGDPRLSLIESVDIHEMIHLVQADRTFEDQMPDFLVNDLLDPEDYPDTLWLSSGMNMPVLVVTNATPDAPVSPGHLSVQLAADMPAGWTYLRVPDPGDGQYRLTQMRRADNSVIALDKNVWTTDRTFIGLGRRPIRENILHALDYNASAGSQTYSLVYEEIPSLNDTNAPASEVLALPASSPATFAVMWSASDETSGAGLAKVEVYVSDNGSPFTRWLESPGAGGSIFNGTQGHTYAFYSIATDQAANRETAPATPDATTIANQINTAPSLAVGANQTVDEGATVVIDNLATDADVPANTVTYSLGAGAPGSAVINPATGRVTWPTGEPDGPATNVFNIVATDNGVPPLSTAGTVTVIVREVNSAPILAPIASFTEDEGTDISFTAEVMDLDLPTNRLTFSLAAGAPKGASINTATGVFTWTPSSTDGPSTNIISIIVTDNGSPSLGATQHFTVIVRDVLSDFTLAMGSTNLMVGESSAVPVTLRSTLDLTNLVFTLTTSDTRLTNLTLQGASPEVQSALIQPLGSNRYLATLTLDPDLIPAAERDVARLAFSAIASEHSAIVPLRVSQLVGVRADGVVITNGAALSGQVIIVGREPVLAITHHSPTVVTLFGHPGAGLAVETRTNLTLGIGWQEIARLILTNRVVPLTVESGAPKEFYRAYEFAPAPPSLEIHSQGGPVLALTLAGQAGMRYTLQTTTNLHAPVFWSNLFTVTLTNSPQSFGLTNTGDPSRYFRALSP